MYYFSACMAQEELAHSTIRTYLSGVHQIQIARSLLDPQVDQMPRLRRMLKRIKIQEGRIGRSPNPHIPITPSILHKLKRVWLSDAPSFTNVMLWAASTTTFFSLCRSGEVTVESKSKYGSTVHLSYSGTMLQTPLSYPFRLKPQKQTSSERASSHLLVQQKMIYAQLLH